MFFDLKIKFISLQVGQLPVKIGRRDVPLVFCSLAKSFKHNTIYLTFTRLVKILKLGGAEPSVQFRFPK